jgi:hypothetical protein
MKGALFLTGILLPVFGYSQNADSIQQSKLTTTSPRLGGINISNIAVPIRTDGNTFIMQLPVVDIGIPVYKKLSSKHPTLIRVGIRYQGLLLSNEKEISGNNFHSITIPLVYSYSFSRSTNISLISLTSVGSDFKQNITGNDILYTVGVRVGFGQKKAFKFGVTLTYSRNYSGVFLLPVPDIDWTISKRLNLTGVLPARISLNYKISQSQSLGLTASVGGSMYRLNESQKKQYMQLQQSSGGLIYDLKLNQRWKLNLITGRTFTQRLETFNMNQKVGLNSFGKLNERISNIYYSKNSFVFQGGISYQF